jgi:hypothetical protein
VWREKRIQNLGELTNRPVMLDGPEVKPVEKEVTIRLGERVDTLLYRIVRPRNYPPAQARQSGQTIFKPRSVGYDGRYFRVKDWSRFFAQRQGQSLATIRLGLQAAVDRHFSTRGEEQQVE